MEFKYRRRVIVFILFLVVTMCFFPSLFEMKNKLPMKQTNQIFYSHNLQKFATDLYAKVIGGIKGDDVHVKKPENLSYLDATLFTQPSHRVNSEVVYGIITNNDLWSVKIGPFTNYSYVKSLSSYLTGNGYDVLLQANKHDIGYSYILYVGSNSSLLSVQETYDNLITVHHLHGSISKRNS